MRILLALISIIGGLPMFLANLAEADEIQLHGPADIPQSVTIGVSDQDSRSWESKNEIDILELIRSDEEDHRAVFEFGDGSDSEEAYPSPVVSMEYHNQEDASPESQDDAAASNEGTRRNTRRPRFDPQVVARGQIAFQDSCEQCHDAERSTSKRKSMSAWMATIRRMARMDGADIPTSDFVPIATYLTSLNAPADSMVSGEGGSGGSESLDQMSQALGERIGSGLNLSATISTLYRGGNDNLENPGFFVDAWVRADWQPSGPLRGRITTCTSCHSDAINDSGFTLELVEATAHLDLLHWLKERCPPGCEPDVQAEIKAGRFVVPFGAFAAMSHPGIYRTVTNPLMYNMGRQVKPDRRFAPVLPAPYSDEGVDLFGKIPLRGKWNMTVDAYAVNGLQGGGAGIQFSPSRSYADNNNELAVGGRATIGNGKLRFGGSIMSGRMHDDMTDERKYRFAGADATARLLDDQVRLYFEYAIRDNQTSLPENQIAYGIVSEIELLLLDEPNLSLLARYDTLEHRNFFNDTSIERYTWGLSTTRFGGSLFMINHERWNFPHDETDVDVFGFRWVATF